MEFINQVLKLEVGYMSPKYAMEGFGVLSLEIVSGRRFNVCLLYTWKLWTKGHAMEFVDLTLLHLLIEAEVLRCIHVGLLCVQEFAKDRTTVYALLSTLTSEITHLPAPKQTGLLKGKYDRHSTRQKLEAP
ncbi:hypothetical protein RJ641_017629 [Dillenia turbinata]|uniref:Uncharacterized protein n=1 Tax=Dillenia turbinata TaxID=194707 RepID=A0AAN8Z132_9MAGN